ncbi:MAG: helix-hairpin-helix domain-containing protein [Chitinophagaceae bacterium]
MLVADCIAVAQDADQSASTLEQQLENIAELNESPPEDDAYLQQMDHFKRHPLNINIASADELQDLHVLSGLQVQQFLAYRTLLGKLVNRYELQAIPSWDIVTIKKLLPFIVIADDKNLVENLKARWRGGDDKLVIRYARNLEKAEGYDMPSTPGANYYTGNRDRYFLRYNYNYKNLLQWGSLAEKDAGEPFFKGKQRYGFDFYSFHFFARQLGLVKALAIGDFTVNFGQGLTQWQSLAFKKNADAMSVKRQSATLRPYTSAGEYNFHRGAAATFQKGRWEATLFASLKKISANATPDSVPGGSFSSLLAGGYHRTPSENEDRNSIQQTAAGGNMKYQHGAWQLGFSSVYYHFSKPVEKSAYPYNLFALQGTSFLNTSIDYSYTWRNMHLFGEAATDQIFHGAFLTGAIISVAANADVSLVYRKIDRAYQSVNANAFTENALPVNEQGLYMGIALRPLTSVRINAYADFFRFPWLRYRVDAPSYGRDFFIQLTGNPNKQVEIYARYKNEAKMINRSVDTLTTTPVDMVAKKNLRVQTSAIISRQVTLKSRVEMVWYNNKGANAGDGFLGNMDVSYKPSFANWAGNCRLQYFETSGYNERIYAYENDLPYSFSIPFYYDKGFRYYINLNWDAGKVFTHKKLKPGALNIALKWAQTIYSGKTSIGSGLDEISGNMDTEIKLQLIMRP